MSEPQRIAKLLARAGIASRRDIERMIAEGRISIDGVIVEKPATLLTSLKGVTVDGQPVKAPEAGRLFVYHKPNGQLVTERDPKGRTTIYDRLPKGLPRLIPVGRLDFNTEGLLLLTNDGELKRQLELPATGVERTYRARTFGPVSQGQLEALIEGVEIDGIRYGQIDANLERRTGANAWIELTLKEGKNREVRRVLEHLGLEVARLIRVRYGPFVLGDLPPGQIGEVRPQDVAAFRKHPTTREMAGPLRPAVPPPPPKEVAPAPAKPVPPKARGPRKPTGNAIAKPTRAARAARHREARAEEFVDRPRPQSPRKPGAGKPGSRPSARPGSRPPRTRK